MLSLKTFTVYKPPKSMVRLQEPTSPVAGVGGLMAQPIKTTTLPQNEGIGTVCILPFTKDFIVSNRKHFQV